VVRTIPTREASKEAPNPNSASPVISATIQKSLTLAMLTTANTTGAAAVLSVVKLGLPGGAALLSVGA